MTWRFIATRLHGDGSESLIHNEVPLSDVELTSTLSGSDVFQGSISPELASLQVDDGEPMLAVWSTAIYAEVDGYIRHGSIVTELEPENGALNITGTGFTGYLNDMPYTSSRSRVKTDPLTEARHMWAHVQGHRHGDLGVIVDDTRSPVRIGSPKKDVSFSTGTGEYVEFEAGPYKLNWWDTDDLGGEFDKLASATPFDYRMEHSWSGESIRHFLRLGYPRLGRRRHDLRFVVNENIAEVPAAMFDGEEYASEVMTLGAGEGRKMVRGHASRSTGRLRRVAVVTDGRLSSKGRANRAADVEVRRRLGELDVTQLKVWEHPHAQIGSWELGDDIYVCGLSGWAGDIGLWVRVVESTISPDESDVAVLTVIRSDKVGG